ncbi:NACHT domain-containing protein [Mucilaginibacter sp. RS28]|uniref:NACHT domain-containing protein n=1 Tax=Mucilaginibacter straminoryzae TaxID=2932774 RepID=A0A9X1X6Y2_9SPHI|nr:NACHT domain-containing protein [Mucilaginibacter straminoryzae]MCJ8210823.1 NACHT domain-containing protein [Mucilaginibacter straminoryzae]
MQELSIKAESYLEKLKEQFNTILDEKILKRLAEYQAEEYKRNYYSKTIIYRTEPVKLNDFYQPLFIRPYGNNHKNIRIDTRSSEELFTANNLITLLGTAGSGKSTIVKYLYTNCVDENFRTPIKVELRYLNKYEGTLYNYLEDEIFKAEQLSLDKKELNKLLSLGGFIFFLDGYDELSSNIKERATKEINDFTRTFANNYFLLTSRPYTNIELLTRFSNFSVCELNDDEIDQFVRKQIPVSELEIASKILEAINEDSNESYKTFLSNPLLLSMFILTFQTYSNIPPKKSTFYKQVFDSLFQLHDSMSKLAYDREKKSGLSKEQFEHVLKVFSYISFFKQAFVFDEVFLNNVFNKIKEIKRTLTFENDYLLDDFTVAICILQKEGLDYTFPHRSLQEYFASLYVVSLGDKQKNEAYSKIFLSLKSFDIIELFTKDNFFSLLVEQDQIGVIKSLTIPFLEHTNDTLKSIANYSKCEGILTSLQYYLVVTHSNLFILSDLLTKLKEYSQHRVRYIQDHIVLTQKKGKINRKVSPGGVEKIKQLNETYGKDIKSRLPKAIRLLKIYLSEEIKSDSFIIDLIDN